MNKQMDLINALSIYRIVLNAQAPTKKRALEWVSELCASATEVADFFHALVEREKLGSTGLGHGVALPHARLAGLHVPMACFLTLAKPIEFEVPDQKPVDLIVGLFVPEDARESHLQLLAQIAQLLSQEPLRDALRASVNAHEVLSLLTQSLPGEQSFVA